ncbi:tenomodulin-like isoform X2 [Salvelinus fontinalis]|uniref:tenomodulin-like isoform X2 n=1 Tax=Salvelinus fontinalis TaxID=8038 RepID=UPI002486569E|nr:tenomodulin-like isoform X2 [Salvelinus fontinalis]
MLMLSEGTIKGKGCHLGCLRCFVLGYVAWLSCLRHPLYQVLFSLEEPLVFYSISSESEGITGIRFAKHQRCYIKTQTRELPKVTEVATLNTEILVGITEGMDMQVVEDSQVWVPAEEPIANPAFLFNSKIWEICQELPIHWIHPSPMRDAEFHEVEDDEDIPDAEVGGHRVARDILDQVPVNDYRDIGVELDNRLDDRGYCCQHCRRGYRYCQRYYEPLGGFNPYPYYYQGGRVICQIIMPCNWWIARMLGRV